MAKKPSNKKDNLNKIKVNTAKKNKSGGKKAPIKKNSKKSYQKKWDKNKGLGLYIRVKSLIWKKYKKDNPKYNGIDFRRKDSDFLKVVHQVYEECKVTGSDCPNYVVIQKYQQISRGLVRREPFVSPKLIGTPQNYWTINELPYALFEPYLWIVSPMIIPAPSEFQVTDYLNSSGDKIGYDKYFRDWVDWCNDEFHNNIDEDYGAYFELQKPQWNEEEKRWEMEIYITTASGVIDSFGYVPPGEPTISKKATPTKAQHPKPKSDVVRTEETDAERELRRAKTLEAQAKADLYKVEALRERKKSYLDELKVYKELEMVEELKIIQNKIKITNLQIEKLTK